MGQSIKKNFIMNAILTMSSFIFPIITFPYISRILKADGTGKVQFAVSFIEYFVLISQLGIPTYGIRACAVVRDDKEELTRTVQELLIISFIMMFISYGLLIPSVLGIQKLASEKLLYLAVSFNILFTCIGMEWMYKALEKYTYITIRSVLFKFIALILMFVLVSKKSDYVRYGAITIFAASASNILNFINAHKFIKMRPVGNYDLKRHLKPIFVFFAMSCAIKIYTNLDNVMLGFMTTDTDVGYYGAAVKIKNVLVSIVTSLGAVLLPRVSYYVKQNLMDEFRAITKKALNFVMIAAAPMMIYFMFYASNGIDFLSGDGYRGAVVPMIVIMPTLMFIGLTNIMGIQVLVPLGREKTVLYSVVAGGIADLVINFLLIPSMHSTGAAIGTLAAEFVVLAVQFYALRDLVAPFFKGFNYLRLAAALVLAAAASLWVKKLGLGNFATLVISAACFFGCYGAVLTLLKEPLVIDIEKQIFAKLRRN